MRPVWIVMLILSGDAAFEPEMSDPDLSQKGDERDER